MGAAFEQMIYLFEAKGKEENQALTATCLVVGGTYGTNDKTTYYRLDFLNKEATGSYYRDILRNHNYQINILDVTGNGYESPDKAFRSDPLNMEDEVAD